MIVRQVGKVRKQWRAVARPRHAVCRDIALTWIMSAESTSQPTALLRQPLRCYFHLRRQAMRTLSADVGEIKLQELIEAAAHGPVTLLEHGKPAAVVLSPAEFQRLDEQDRIRRQAKTRLRETISKMHREAAERGLTEADLERLLSDES
jgi:prevent-host-death family protein